MDYLKEAYIEKYQNYLSPSAKRLESYLKDLLKDVPRIDNICTRAKSVDRFLGKAEKLDDDSGDPKYELPLDEIQDQVGARIVVFYLSDVKVLSDLIKKHFAYVENAVKAPPSDKEFGYFGEHFILTLPTDVTYDLTTDSSNVFELQIKTLFQHAWSEAEHDSSYKAPSEMTSDERRLVALSSAHAWAADKIFDSFFKQITDRASDSGE
jgi:ppGpp synthetase/RelA/SpoT-type nucleotidyltranferase